MVILGGWVFLMSEVPLYLSRKREGHECQSISYRGTSLIRTPHPPRTPLGPQAWAYGRVLGGSFSCK
jgi:hypothetical protein